MWFIGCDVGVVGILERVWQLDHAPVLDHGADGRMDGADARRCAGRLDGLGERVTRCPGSRQRTAPRARVSFLRSFKLPMNRNGLEPVPVDRWLITPVR
jgi:hypothetical protein